MIIKDGDYVRLAHPYYPMPVVCVVIEVSAYASLVRVGRDDRVHWVNTEYVELMTPFEVVVHKRLEEGDA